MHVEECTILNTHCTVQHSNKAVEMEHGARKHIENLEHTHHSPHLGVFSDNANVFHAAVSHAMLRNAVLCCRAVQALPSFAMPFGYQNHDM